MIDLDEITPEWILRDIMARNKEGGIQCKVRIVLMHEIPARSGMVTVQREITLSVEEVLKVLYARSVGGED